ncbi:hypothetical protein [Streptomyces scabiei]|uniref:hypothetical protein n=1 Tax=Streptomyces scabiei TaxID=1930 RepID=UPI0029AD7CED|nr:hypothetical protein [Streptomyces scabiei]MDX3206082.1 hypothetical protein [Streptomyces scabiei]
MKKMITVVHCDACAKKGDEQDASTTLSIAGDSYDLCDQHGEKFRAYFEALFTAEMTVAQSA